MSALTITDDLYISDVHKMFLVKIACFSCMTFSIYEGLITLEDESLWVWTLPKRSPTLWLYVLSKYFALAVQISNLVATLYFHSRYPILNDQTCRMWFLFRVTAAQTMLMCVELILMIRVYALYLHSHRIAVLMLVILLCESIVMGNAVKILHQHLEFNYTCLINKAPRIISYFGTGGMLTQVIIISLTFFKQNSALRDRWRAPVLSIMIRDGSAVFIVISIVLVINMIYKVFRREVASVVFSGFISMASSIGCRLITNMRKSISVPESDDSYRLSSAVPHASVSEFEHCVALPRPEPFLSETTSTIDDPLSAQ